MDWSATLRRAFLSSSYGLPGERFWLGPTPAARWLSWAPPGRRWAVVTAWNPGGGAATAGQNSHAQQALRQRCPGAVLDGVNGEGSWAEASLILLDVPLSVAIDLGRNFGQAAVLSGSGRRVALVWLDAQQVRMERYWVTSSPAPGRPVPDALYSGGL